VAEKKPARVDTRKVKDRWKAKAWYNVYAPEYFGQGLIGETLSDDAAKLEGRVTQITLQDITGDFSQMHVKLSFKVDRIVGTDAHTMYIGHDLTSDYVRRLTRRKHSKMDVVHDVTTLDGWRIRVKPMAITERRIKASQQEAIRHAIVDTVSDYAGKATLPELIRSIISGEMSKSIFRKCKPVYPIKRIEIRKSEILARDFVPTEPLPASTANIFAPPAPPEPEPAPAEGGTAAPAEDVAAPAPEGTEAAPATMADKEEEAEDEEESEVDPETVRAILASFEAVPGIGPAKAQTLFEAGYRSVDELRELPVEDLAKVEGFSEALAQKVLESLKGA
jgi:small subunit ribosomal protein S3Ae